MKNNDSLDLKATFLLILLTALWGFNYVVIKYSNQGISPIFTSTLRSIIASICGLLYCYKKKEIFFHGGIMLFHGLMVGVLFGLEFACIYLGLLYTDAARSVIFVYTSPFIVAIGAHLFLRGDKLNLLKIIGLIIAFTGIFVVFGGKPFSAKPTMWIGDALEVLAAFFWGATTIYIKRFMAEKIHPINTFLYQLVFSIPILFCLTLILEPKWIYRFDPYIASSLFYQSVIIAFISYFLWFKLIHNYSVSRLSSFTFFTPIFGVISGILFLNEELTFSLIIGLPLVSIGIFFVNWRIPQTA
jgi:drug/metabolite transporter (DMT)-like permease